MNGIVHTFLLAGDILMPKMHLRQPGVTYSACGSFAKNKERIQKFIETGDSRYIYLKEVDKAWFQHDTAYGNFKSLPTTIHKLLETNSSFYVKQRTTGKVQFLFYSSFLLIKFSFWVEDWALGYNSMKR